MDNNETGPPAIPSRHETPLHNRTAFPPPGPPPSAPPGGVPAVAPPATGERRRAGWAEFRRAYPGIIAVMAVAFLTMLAIDGWLIFKRRDYGAEIDRLRSGMTDAERKQADAVIAAEQNKLRVAIELVRRQAQGDKDLHVSVEVDSGRMVLEQDGALLREMPVDVAPDRIIGSGPDTVRMTRPRGARTVEKILTGDNWEVPRWVFTDRAIPVPDDRNTRGALGPVAIVLNGGTVIYSLPQSGPLADPGYVLPGSIRARTSDLRAIIPNLKAGSTVYFY